jgi:hypothetical protein
MLAEERLFLPQLLSVAGFAAAGTCAACKQVLPAQVLAAHQVALLPTSLIEWWPRLLLSL